MGRAAAGTHLNRRFVVRAARAVVHHPSLWATGIVQVFRLAPTGWWRRWPPLPMPDPGYLRFRLQTAYGDPDRDPEPEDVVTYLRWVRETARIMG